MMLFSSNSGLLAACGGSPILLVARFAAAGGKARHQQKNVCELPQAVRGQEGSRPP